MTRGYRHMNLEATSVWFGVLALGGGIGMFLYGMLLMNEGLQLAAGDRLRRMLETFTKTRYRGLAAGTIVTTLIQSSSATTVMLVGFVNAGLMTFTQSLGVILGADIGTTITAQIVAFDVILYLSFPCIGIGLLLFLAGNRRVVKYSGEVILGFGLLFLGMEFMKGGMSPLKDSGFFQSWVNALGDRWYLSLLLGLVFTSLVQSSSATTSMLVAMGATGALSIGGADPLRIAIPVILGCNIGTCITAWIASLGTSLPAKRVAWAHYLFKIGGVILVLPFLAWLPDLVRWASGGLGTGESDIGRQIAWAHTFFNLFVAIAFLPLLTQFAALVKKIKKGAEPEILRDPLFLDPRIFHSPAMALEMARKEITRMGRITLDMLHASLGYLKKHERGGKKHVMELESIVDGLANSINTYLSKLSQVPLTFEQSEQLVGFMHAVNDIERIGDHAENIMYLALNKMESGEGFSGSAAVELDDLSDTVFEMYEGIVDAFESQDAPAAVHFQDLEHHVDEMASKYRDNHLKRLNRGECNGTVGVIYLDTLGNLERIGDLANNVGHVTTGELQKL